MTPSGCGLYEVVTMLLERASENGPLVVIMEDIHWADESTRHVLRFWHAP